MQDADCFAHKSRKVSRLPGGDEIAVHQNFPVFIVRAGISQVGLDRRVARHLPAFDDACFDQQLGGVTHRGDYQIPLERLGKPNDIAGMVAFLSSEYASYITGQVFVVDGGMVM